MLLCVVVAFSTGFASLHAPLRAPHIHSRPVTRPVLHQRAAAAVGAVEAAVERRVSATEAHESIVRSKPVAATRVYTEHGLAPQVTTIPTRGCRNGVVCIARRMTQHLPASFALTIVIP